MLAIDYSQWFPFGHTTLITLFSVAHQQYAIAISFALPSINGSVPRDSFIPVNDTLKCLFRPHGPINAKQQKHN